MSDRVERLRATLAELEAELSEVETLDPESRARLQEVADEISAALERSEPEPQFHRPETLNERLLTDMETFRVQHPTLAGVIERLVNGLAQLGI